MTERQIFAFLKSQGLSDAGCAGAMGNMFAESGLNSRNLQNSYEKKLGYTDASYTKAVDNGSYRNFAFDKAGYGLCQWTYSTRKAALLAFAKTCGTSIGDAEMQLKFFMKELRERYPKVLSVLKTSKTVREASDAVLLNFERPADQSAAVRKKRAEYGQAYYNTLTGKETTMFTNSPLVSYIKISPNRTPNRNHAIDTITIHCVVGQCSVETLGEVFAPKTRQASSNYGIGPDGRIGMYVEEKDRSWCSSSASNDNRAVTIEVASDTTHPYKVKDAAYKALIELVADICKRNGIKELKWKADKSLIGQIDKQNMTVHRWFANKSCPGDYLYNLHGQIAAEVNKRLGVSGSTAPVVTPSKSTTPYRVRVKIKNLNIRKGPGTQNASNGFIAPGVYTIVSESKGSGASMWGKLKSGAGWISLDYCEKL